jgi:predicted  nucleic acid-binding Zn-ribbon protein
MSLTVFDPTDFRLGDLKRQFISLERELADIQAEYTTLKIQHGQKCTKSLKDSLSSLLDVVKYVNKADKALIYWVEKGGALKLALRCIGVDKRTEAIARRKTKNIHNQVTRVENLFSQTSGVFMDSLKAVQDLNVTVTQYSLSTLGDAQRQANILSDDLDSSVQAIQMKLEKTCLERTSIQEEIDIIPSQISGVESQRSNAQNASDSNAVVSIFDPSNNHRKSVD